jgi:hypothetical protein
MKTAGRENPNRWATAPRNRAHGAAGQNRSRSIKWAVKQEKFQPKEMCFFLTYPFIERFRTPLCTMNRQILAGILNLQLQRTHTSQDAPFHDHFVGALSGFELRSLLDLCYYDLA